MIYYVIGGLIIGLALTFLALKLPFILFFLTSIIGTAIIVIGNYKITSKSNELRRELEEKEIMHRNRRLKLMQEKEPQNKDSNQA